MSADGRGRYLGVDDALDDYPDVLLPHALNCPCNECYATLQAEHLAAADLDPRWPA